MVAEVITSAQNPFVKACVKLRESSRERKERGECLLVGKKIVMESPAPKILILAEGVEFKSDLEKVIVSNDVMKKITGLMTPDGVAAIHPLPKSGTFKNIRRLIAFDGIQDPGNLGTLLRTALALGWDGAYFLPNTCDPFGEKGLRASLGASLRFPIGQGDVEELKKICKENQMTPLAAHLNGIPFDQVDLCQSILLVLGAEGQGISDEMQQFCEKITIPMSGEMESLNVATAGAILLYGLKHALR
jgi:TrmH family RNA methyltransferase